MFARKLVVSSLLALSVFMHTACSTSTTHLGSVAFESGGGVEVHEFYSYDWFGQNLRVGVFKEKSSTGEEKVVYFPVSGNGFLQQIGPAAAQAAGFWAGMSARDADRFNIRGGTSHSESSPRSVSGTDTKTGDIKVIYNKED